MTFPSDVMDAIKELYDAAKEHGLEVVKRGPRHFQIRGGPLLVNYYPESKRRTLYIAGMNGSIPHVNPSLAVQIALDPSSTPKLGAKKSPRLQHRAQRYKRRRFSKAAREGLDTIPCHWCETPLTRETATVDHIVPLHRGGLDHHNNFCLSCGACNHDKGNKMPGRRNHE